MAVPNMWRGVPDEVLGEEVLLPSQFMASWQAPLTPERTLALAVLWSAVIDLRKYRFATRRRPQRLFMETYHWVVSDAMEWEFSFARLCELFHVRLDEARSALLDGWSQQPLFRPFADEVLTAIHLRLLDEAA